MESGIDLWSSPRIGKSILFCCEAKSIPCVIHQKETAQSIVSLWIVTFFQMLAFFAIPEVDTIVILIARITEEYSSIRKWRACSTDSSGVSL